MVRDNFTMTTNTIEPKPAAQYLKPTLAAGAVLWRHSTEGVRVAVIHRPRYDDWSLAKGKVDPGENLPTTAVREIAEETGCQVQLGTFLGHVHYPVGQRTKVIYYWTAEVVRQEFKPNDEVDEMRWLSFDEALDIVSYDVDRKVLRTAQKALVPAIDCRILLVRHAHAHPREGWAGNDNLRPIDRKGRKQLKFIGKELQGWNPTSVISAIPMRCQDTAQAIADELGVAVSPNEHWGDTTYHADPAITKRQFDVIRKQKGTFLIVSQGDTIKGLLKWITADTSLEMTEPICKKAGVWVLSFSEGQLRAADYMASPLPVK